ncbi:hypothetical protein A1O7_02973 [Cladophialophora yegresii CBS 114405]|uniref:N-acetyltransferase domain-containing protein n=1 Tax=Cladophialophora yegresii CBS 114405 TaxID=1182544 RepID=W9WC24_9EURO|nr:uncharacterized protein A1O7_02973 [Cladophialophora yegresii CBS 114405]EXJ62535.1 hypothetical protein A1O7_02973 [Cladophialophora yegresii CBS 114405]
MGHPAPDASSPPLPIFKTIQQLPRCAISHTLQELRTLERKSFAANDVFHFDDKVVKQRNMEILVGLNHHSTVSRVVAYAVSVTSNRRLLLHKICVSPERRRQRIGYLLMEILVGTAKRRSCRGIDLWVDEANHAAQGLYFEHGFSVQEIVQDYYSPGRNGVKMALDLID